MAHSPFFSGAAVDDFSACHSPDRSDLAAARTGLHRLARTLRPRPDGRRRRAFRLRQGPLGRTVETLPTFHGALAFLGEKPVGLINCFAGFSTFAAKPLLNIHDVVVHADVRGQGIAQALLQWAETQARQLGCCKLTLEILSNNIPAMRSYERAGFEPYVLDPAAGHALLMQKYLQEI
jgi:GNAT superfamily N-acetyltransferase